MKRSEARSTVRARVAISPVSFVLPLVVIALFALRRVSQMGSFPTGLDGGEWLAIGDGLLGAPARHTGGGSAPLVPLLIALISRVTGPIDAVLLVAFLTWTAMLFAIAWVASSASNGWGTAAVVCVVASASAMTEALAFGGYPQQLAIAGLVCGLAGLARWLQHGTRRNWWIAAFGFALATLSHHLYGTIAIVASFGVLGLATLDPGLRTRLRQNLGAAIALLLLATGLLAPTLLAMRAAGYSPPFDAVRLSVIGAWQYGTREAVILWTILVAVAVLAIITRFRADGSSLWLVSTACLSVSGLAFLIEPQPRLLPLLLTSAVLAILNATSSLPPEWRRSAGVAVLMTVVVLVGRGDGEADAFFRYYRVLDASLISASRAVEQSHPAGNVAVRSGQSGWPIGWWVDGLTTVPVATGSDPRWLGFPRERSIAVATNRLFDGSLTPAALRNEARVAGVSTLVLRKWDWIGWDRWLGEGEPAVTTVYDDNITLVLIITPDFPNPAGV